MKNFRVFIIGLLLLPVVAVGALFYIQGPDGNPLMNMGKLKQSFESIDLDWSLIEQTKQAYYKIRNKAKNVNLKNSLPEALKKAPKTQEPVEADPETLYKWRDKSGNLHFSNQLPPNSVEFEIVESGNKPPAVSGAALDISNSKLERRNEIR